MRLVVTRRAGAAVSMLHFQVAGAEVGGQLVLPGAGPFELWGKTGVGFAKRSGIEVANLHGSIHSPVIIGVRDGNRDVAGFAIDIFVIGDGADLEVVAGETAGDVCRGRHFDGRSKIVVRRIFDGEIRMGAGGRQIGRGVGGVAGKR